MEKLKINKNTLKLIAFITMIIDHIGYAFFPQIKVLRIIGRISFPIFAFSVAEGYLFTKSKYKYILKLFILAVISIIPFSLFVDNSLISFKHFNVLFTLCGGIISIHLSEKIKKIDAAFLLFLIAFIAELLKFDYGAIGILFIFFIYHFGVKKDNKIYQSLIIILLGVFLSLMSDIKIYYLISVPINILLNYLYCKNKTFNKNISKWLYLIYPLHLIIIYLIKCAFF